MTQLLKAVLSFCTLCWMTSAQITVIVPTDLRTSFRDKDGNYGKIEGSTATFGTPDFGVTMQGQLFFAESPSKTHCSKDDYTLPEPSNEDYAKVQQPRIVLVRRGDCSFVTKVQIAQDYKKAAAVLIVDKPLDKGGDTVEQLRNIIVADDGWGASVRIPSILITHEDGEKLIREIQKPNAMVIAELAWDIPTNDIVVMDKWIMLTNKDSLEFLSDFAKWREAFGSQLSFKPHFMLGMSMYTAPENNHHQCLDDKGVYCFRDPDKDGAIEGQDVIKENIRMLCIHEITTEFSNVKPNTPPAEKPQYSKAFWDFIYDFPKECPLPEAGKGSAGLDEDHRFGEKCTKRLMAKVQISESDMKKIDKCYQENQPGRKYKCRDCGEEVQNYWLDKMRNQIAWHDRALRLNGWRYTGDYNVHGVVGAICKAYTVQPAVCTDFFKGNDPPQVEVESGGMSFTTLVVACGIVIIVTVGGLLCYQRSLRAHLHSALREEVMLEVQSQMETYKQLPS